MSSEDLVIAFSGKLSPRKGPDQLVEAVRRLPTDVRDRCVILMVGDGELKEHLQAMAATAPAVRINQVGFQPQGSLSHFYHAADLLVLPSLHAETWGLVVNEALHHGVPAVVSDAVGCAPDLIAPGETGETFSAGSVSELSAALLRCLNLSGSEDARRRCRAKVGDYSTARAAEGIAAAYNAALSRHQH